MAIFASGKIEAFVGPTQLGAPDDLEAEIVRFIVDARTSLDIAVQELDSPAIAQAIVDARWRGVSVNIFLEQDYLKSNLQGSPPTLPMPQSGESQADALLRAQWGADTTELAENQPEAKL